MNLAGSNLEYSYDPAWAFHPKRFLRRQEGFFGGYCGVWGKVLSRSLLAVQQRFSLTGRRPWG